MVSVAKYISRICHVLSFIVLGGHGLLQVLTGTNIELPGRALAATIVIMLGSGTFNAIVAQPSKTMGPAGKPAYMNMLYAKTALFLAHPLVPVVLGKGTPAAAQGQAAVIILAVLIASYSRFYREEAQAAYAASKR